MLLYARSPPWINDSYGLTRGRLNRVGAVYWKEEQSCGLKMRFLFEAEITSTYVHGPGISKGYWRTRSNKQASTTIPTLCFLPAMRVNVIYSETPSWSTVRTWVGT